LNLTRSATPAVAPPYSGPCPDLDAALRARKVSFDQVCEAYFGQTDASEELTRNEYQRLYPELQRMFGECCGGPPVVFFTKPSVGLRGGAAQTGDCRFHLSYDAGLSPATTVFLLSQLEAIETRSHTMLSSGDSMRQFSDLAYAAATTIFSIMELQAAASSAGQFIPDEDMTKRVRVAKAELRDLAAYVETASQTRARAGYSLGMAYGLALVLAVSLVLNWFIPAVGWLRVNDAHFLFYTLILGGLGAVVSVISRAGSMTLRYEVGYNELVKFGVFRPLVGAVFGFVLCALIRSKVLNFASPPDASEALFYYVGAAFIAGFSERLAPGILESAARRINLSASDKREVGSEGS
jgi:hypothetical protein